MSTGAYFARDIGKDSDGGDILKFKNVLKKYGRFIVSVLIALAVGGLSALLSGKGSSTLYESVKTPPLSPPAAVFPIVWTALYILMGVSAAVVYEKCGDNVASALKLYILSLAVNFSWTLVFFNARAFFPALMLIAALIALVIATVAGYAKFDRTAAALQIPYLLWVCFAAYLNAGIWLLNR